MGLFDFLRRQVVPVAAPALADLLGKRLNLPREVSQLWANATIALVNGEDPHEVSERAMKAAIKLAAMRGYRKAAKL